jgi:hypothetical protein
MLLIISLFVVIYFPLAHRCSENITLESCRTPIIGSDVGHMYSDMEGRNTSGIPSSSPYFISPQSDLVLPAPDQNVDLLRITILNTHGGLRVSYSISLLLVHSFSRWILGERG